MPLRRGLGAGTRSLSGGDREHESLFLAYLRAQEGGEILGLDAQLLVALPVRRAVERLAERAEHRRDLRVFLP
jgi:hypothetical protein